MIVPQGPLTQPYFEYFAPEYQLNLRTTRAMPNDNVAAEVDRIKATVFENLRQLASAPGEAISTMSPGGLRCVLAPSPYTVTLQCGKFLEER